MTQVQANLLLLAIAAVWGLAFIFQKTAMEHVGPLQFVALRSFVAAAALFPLALVEARGRGPFLPAGLTSIGIGAAVMFFIGAALQQAGLVTATVTNTGFLTGLYVVVTPLIVWALYRRAPAGHVWLAVGLAFVGTWFLGGGTLGGLSYGDVLVAISALFWAGHMVVVERSARFGRPCLFTALQFVFVGVLAASAAATFETISLARIADAWREILFVGLLSSAMTFTLLAVAMRYTPAPEAAILVSTETLFAALCAALILSEQLSAIGWIGAALMFSATLVVQGEPYLRARRARRAGTIPATVRPPAGE